MPIDNTDKAAPIYDLSGISGLGQPDGDDVNLAARIARLESNAPYQLRGGATAPMIFSPLAPAGIVNGKLDVASTNSVTFKGAMAPSVVDGLFACTTTATTITWYWDGTNSSRVFVIRRADGKTTTVPGGSITVTGLTASITYSYYPTWISNGSYQVAWAPGDTGTPAIAMSPTALTTLKNQAVWFQALAGREPMTAGAMTFAQPASGTGGGGGGGGGGDGRCVMLGTKIVPLGAHEHKEAQFPESSWVEIETDRALKLCCTLDHPLYSDEGITQAARVRSGTWLLTENGEDRVLTATRFTKEAIKVQVSMMGGHLFWANGFLSHNIKAN